MPTLPHEVTVWINGLNLSTVPRNPHWDLANGYIVAEIFAKYFRAQFPLYKYSKNIDVNSRKANWNKLEKFAAKFDLKMPAKLIEGTANRRPDAAIMLLSYLYEVLTGNVAQTINMINNPFLMDINYQRTLKLHQRCTLKSAIERNFASPEAKLHYSTLRDKDKTRQIINVYKEEKRGWMTANPKYFGHKKSIREKAVRRDELPKAATESKGVSVFTSIETVRDISADSSLPHLRGATSKIIGTSKDSGSLKTSQHSN